MGWGVELDERYACGLALAAREGRAQRRKVCAASHTITYPPLSPRKERAGVHIVYGFRELKTHAKVAIVVRREEDGLRKYVHFG